MSDSNDYKTVRAALSRSRANWAEEPDEALIREKTDAVAAVIAPALSETDRERLVRELLTLWDVSTDEGVALIDTGFIPWLTEERRQSINWVRGDAYRDYLIDEGRPLKSVNATDDDSFEILGLLGDPASAEPFDRRGLILGDVQSGKTSSYLSVIGKAADAGYRLIVVLAGQTDRLREQTQVRIDEGFIGRRAAVALQPGGEIGIGVGRKLPVVQGLTTATSDFSVSQLRGFNISMDGSKSVFTVVLKKNKSVLETFAKWLGDQDKSVIKEIPLLVLDDESDYASVNTKNINKPELDPTAINKAIRKLLKTFTKKSYVAYTATPFANVFIDHTANDDLFPRDFIYALEAPSNYVGVPRVFGAPGEESPSTVHAIEDAEEVFPFKHKKDLKIEELPDSLVTALQAFAIHNAVRDLRSTVNKPRAMLINVSRFTDVHQQVEQQVTEEWQTLKRAIDAHARRMDWSTSPAIAALHRTYSELFSESGATWDEVRNQLSSAVSRVRVRTYNSAPENKNRDAGASDRIIAIGGAVLSRGLTLDGLGISYFYQRPRASDTLLQMGRWFGYRDGYEDVCHVWIDPEVQTDFQQAYDSIEDLREDLRRMVNESLTPRDFGIAVQRHPDALLITAQNKMQAAELKSRPIWAFAQRLETVKLDASDTALEENLGSTKHLFESLVQSDGHFDEGNGFVRWKNVDYEVVRDFLTDYQGSDEERPALDPQSLAGFTARLGRAKFPTWDIVFSGQRLDNGLTWSGRDVPARERTCEHREDKELLIVSGKGSRLAGSTDVANLLDKTTKNNITRAWRSSDPKHAAKTPSETVYYQGFDHPVLMIYVLRPTQAGGAKLWGDDNSWLVALKFIFPGEPYSKGSRPEEMFYLNSVAAERLADRNYAYDTDDSGDEW